MDNSELIKQLQSFADAATSAVNAINKELPKLMDSLPTEQKKELQDILNDKDWNNISLKLAHAQSQINNIK